jgi:branched-chain amino acid transport system permease protein
MDAINGQLLFNGLAIGLVYVILCSGMVMIQAVNQIIFVAYGQFYTIGAFVTWYGVKMLHLPYFPSLILAIAVTGVMGMLTYFLILRRIQFTEGKFLATLIASMGLMLVLAQGGLLVFGTTPQSIPPIFPGVTHAFGISINNDKAIVIILGVIITLFLFWFYEKTRIGRGMRAVSFMPEIASLHGINTDMVFLFTLGVGTALAGIAGGIIAPTYGIDPLMGQNIVWTIMAITMTGGADSLLGALAGGIIVGQILSFGQFYIGGMVQVILFVIIGVILYFRPNGLLGRGINIGVE